MNLDRGAVRQVTVRFTKVRYRDRPIAARPIVHDGMNADVRDSLAAAIGSDVLQSQTWTCHPALNSPRAFATASTGLVKSVRILSSPFDAWTTSAAIELPAKEK
jgi:hypothetical protein